MTENTNLNAYKSEHTIESSNNALYSTDEKQDTETNEKDDATSNDRNNYLLLCRLLTEGVTYTLRNVFDRLHPPEALVDRLNKLQVKYSWTSLIG